MNGGSSVREIASVKGLHFLSWMKHTARGYCCHAADQMSPWCSSWIKCQKRRLPHYPHFSQHSHPFFSSSLCRHIQLILCKCTIWYTLGFKWVQLIYILIIHMCWFCDVDVACCRALDEGRCVVGCASGKYQSGGRCHLCDHTCATCVDAGPANCTSCDTGEYEMSSSR